MARVFDESFKKMAVELSYLKDSVTEAAKELDLAPSRLSKWRQDPRFGFSKIRYITEDHVTPFKTKQNFIFCSFKRTSLNTAI